MASNKEVFKILTKEKQSQLVMLATKQGFDIEEDLLPVFESMISDLDIKLLIKNYKFIKGEDNNDK